MDAAFCHSRIGTMRGRFASLGISIVSGLCACGDPPGPASGAVSPGSAGGRGGAGGVVVGAGGAAGSASSAAAGASGQSGGAGAEGVGGGGAGVGGFVPAAHRPFPTVTFQGGATLKHPEIFTITYPGYAYAADVEAWAEWVPTSDWLIAVGTEYAVGSGKHTGHLVMPNAAPAVISDDEIKVLLVGLVKSGSVPTPTGQTLFMIFFPESTTVKIQASASCVAFGAYHASAGGPSSAFSYAVEPTCPGMKFGPDELSGLEVTASHELIEAATDALPESKPAWLLSSGPSSGAFAFIGGEVGDLCAHQPIEQDGFWVQRSWSVAAAASGQNPCVPVPPGEIYYNVSVPLDAIRAVAAGESTVFDVTGWSLDLVPDWEIDAQVKLADFAPILELDQPMLNNGQIAHLKVTVPAGTPSQAQAGFVVRSLRGGDKDNYTMWPMAVHVP